VAEDREIGVVKLNTLYEIFSQYGRRTDSAVDYAAVDVGTSAGRVGEYLVSAVVANDVTRPARRLCYEYLHPACFIHSCRGLSAQSGVFPFRHHRR
jgi:hypothetical protein